MGAVIAQEGQEDTDFIPGNGENLKGEKQVGDQRPTSTL